MINILIVDDQEVVGEGTKRLLATETEFAVDFVISSTETKSIITAKRYDVYIIDLYMKRDNALDLSAEILNTYKDAKVLIFTEQHIHSVFNQLIEIGISGFISKSYSKRQLIRVIWCVIEGQVVIPKELLSQLRWTEIVADVDGDGKISLSQKEVAILIKAAEGMTNDAIAEVMYMSRRNVERYLTGIFKKLRVKSRYKAIEKGRKIGLLPVASIPQ